MDGYSWQDQNSGLATSGWAPLYMMGSQMGYGQQQPAQPGSFGSAPPLGMSPSGLGAPQPSMQGMQGQTSMQDRTAEQQAPYPQGMDPSQVSGPMSSQFPMSTGPNFGQSYGQPLSMSNFAQPQGRQILGNPTTSYMGGSGGIMSTLGRRG
jgi:hypothetical protein